MAFNDYLARLIITIVGMVYPGYQSFKAVKRDDVPKQQAWLKYWLVLSVVAAVDLIVEPFLYDRIPLWNVIKIAVVIFLASPMTNGYEKVYAMVLEPQLDRYETTIDETASKLYKAGEEQARSLGPTLNKYVQQGKSMATNTLNKKAS